MRDLVILFVHVSATLVRLPGPGGIRSVVAESVLVKHQLLILNCSRQRSPHLRTSDRLVAGLCALLIRPARQIALAFGIEISKDMVRRILVEGCIRHPSQHDSAARTLEHESALINDKVDKRNPHRAR